MLTRGYGTIPTLFPESDWNWEGKLLALAATIAIASLPVFGWKNAGLTLRQTAASARAVTLPVLLYCGIFLALALIFPNGENTAEGVAFQLTMPGFDEEPFYRGILLLSLDRAFAGRVRIFGADLGWGAALSCAVFGLAHSFGYSSGSFSFDPMTFALTALPSFIAAWLRIRSGSLLLPVFLHNFGNSILLLV